MRWMTLVLAFAAAASAQGPRIFIVTDLEGVAGVNNWDELGDAGSAAVRGIAPLADWRGQCGG